MTGPKYFKTFLIRFLGYFFVITGLMAFFFQFGPVLQAEAAYRFDRLFRIDHVLSAGAPGPGGQAKTFGQVSSSLGGGDVIKPASTDYGIVIEKINANTKVVPNVDPGNRAEYIEALKYGVAESKGSTKPGEPGNLYLFAHSTDAPWNVARYNAVFYLLRELNPGDRVVIFYKGVRYDYYVFDKVVVPPTDVSFLTNRYDKPVLTLQTCDPPGTTLNRLIVRAKLVGS